MKSAVISLDLLIASPIALLGVAMLFASMAGALAYFSAVFPSQQDSFGKFAVSQEISSTLDSLNGNYSTANSIAISIAAEHGLSALLLPPNGTQACSGASLCRFVTVENSTLLLVISDENTNES